MNVALVTPSYLPSVGGLELVVHSLGAALQRRGSRVVVVSHAPADGQSATGPVEGPPVWRMDLEPPLARHRLLAPVTDAALLARHGLGLAQRLRPFGPSLVAAQFVGPSAASAAVAAKLLGLPVVVTPQGSDLQRFPMQSRRYRLLAQAVLGAASFVTFPSHDLGREASLLVPGLTTKSTYIPNGVDLGLLGEEAPASGRAPDEPFLLSVGRLEPVKGHDVLLRAFADLASSHPGLRLVVVGDGSRRWQLSASAVELGVAGRVSFTGQVDRAEVARLVRRCEAVVVPSRSEGRGLFLLEAMAMGKPVVASRVGGIPEVVEDGRTGVLVPSEDPDALARAVASLLASPRRQKELGRNARAAAARYDWDEVAGAYLGLFEDLIARRKPKRRDGLAWH